MNRSRVILAGGSGFIGQALSRHLIAIGYDVVVLTRSISKDKPEEDAPAVRLVQWDGRTPGEWARLLDGARAVVNLAGKNVNCRYTKQNLEVIDRSRVDSVRAVGEAIAACRQPPEVLVQSGTLAIYGDTGDRWCDENTPPGEGIPPQTAVKWEAAFDATPTPKTRRVLLRISFVLGHGGVLAVLARLARWFLGGAVGSGKQYISWIYIDDLCRLIAWAIERPDVAGVYNATSPNPVTNAQFMRELRRTVGRPWSPRTPAWMVRVGSFFMRTEPVLALTGRRGSPAKLITQGFECEHTDLGETLRNLLR